MDDLYYDCASSSTDVGDRRISSSYTHYGIKCIDSEYGHRIRNIYKPVIRLIKIERVPHYENAEKTWRSDYWDDYTELPLDEDFYSYDRVAFIHDDNEPYRLLEVTDDMQRYIDRGRAVPEKVLTAKEYTYTHPTYVAKFKGEDPEALRKEIKNNPHLHKKIKKNLLENLDSYLKN